MLLPYFNFSISPRTQVKTPADEKTLRILISYSPVYEMVSRVIPVEVSITIES